MFQNDIKFNTGNPLRKLWGVVVVAVAIALLVVFGSAKGAVLKPVKVREIVYAPAPEAKPVPKHVDIVSVEREGGPSSGPAVSQDNPAPHRENLRPFTQPKDVPKEIAKVDPGDNLPPVDYRSRGNGNMVAEGGDKDGPGCNPPFCGTGLDPTVRVAPPPVSQQAVKESQLPRIVRVGGQVRQPEIVSQQPPVYPALAKQIRLSGVVVLHAIITVEGSIRDLRAVSGHPLLIPAAMDAVKHWRYQPTLLNREPVEVDADITVNFTLRQ